jgi:chaperone BCS1
VEVRVPALRPARHRQVEPRRRHGQLPNYLRFNLYDLDLSHVHSNLELQKLLIAMPNKCILVIEDMDIDCCFSANAWEGAKQQEDVNKDAAATARSD